MTGFLEQISFTVLPVIFSISFSTLLGFSRKMTESRTEITVGRWSFLVWSIRSFSVTTEMTSPLSSTTGTPLILFSQRMAASLVTGTSSVTVITLLVMMS